MIVFVYVYVYVFVFVFIFGAPIKKLVNPGTAPPSPPSYPLLRLLMTMALGG